MLALLSFVVLSLVSDPQLTVRGPEPEVVRLGSQAIITLALEGGASGDSSLGALPEVDGVELTAGRPTQSSFQSIVNGKVTGYSSISWKIAVEPRREGVFEIPPITIQSGGKKLSTKPLRVEAVRDISGEKYAFLEIAVPRESYFVQEPIKLKIRFGFEEHFVSSNLIQLFSQRLDIPVQVRAKWADELPGTVSLADNEKTSKDGQRFSFALNERVYEALRVENQTRDGHQFLVLEIEKTFLPTNSGELNIPESLIRFAYATKFQNDFFGGRVAADKTDGFVYAKGLSLKIQPLPDAGRPPEFTGAVGRFTIQAEANPRELRVGESLKFTLRIEGEGNLDYFDPPRLDELKDFHVYGKIEEKADGKRTITYDLAPLKEEIQELPSISFAYFDTNNPPGYRGLKTSPISIKVKPLPEGTALKPLPGDDGKRAIAGETDIFDMKSVSGIRTATVSLKLGVPLVLFAVLSPWALALIVISARRARERDRRDPSGVRARNASSAFAAQIQGADSDLADAFAEFLAAKLRCPQAAVIAPDLSQRLQTAGVSENLSKRAADMLDSLIASRYGGRPSAQNTQSAQTLVQEIEAAFLNNAEGRR